MADTGSLREYAETFTALGLPDVFSPHLLKMWASGVPAEYAVAALKATSSVKAALEMWAADIPLEYAGA